MDGMIPDRVSIDPESPHFWPHYRKLGVTFNGRPRSGDVHEFCVSEGWAMVRIRTRLGYETENGKFKLQRIEGMVMPYWTGGMVPDVDRESAAEAKRARRAAKRLRDARVSVEGETSHDHS